MDLKWLLMRRITAAALACLLAGSALALYQTAKLAQRQNTELVALVGMRLEHQLGTVSGSDVPRSYPDWEPVTKYALQAGQCVELRGPDGVVQRSRCAGVEAAASSAPQWFFAAHSALINPRVTAVGPLSGAGTGLLVASFNPAATAARAWSTIAPLLGLSAAFVLVLCIVTYLAIDRALTPAKEILSGLNRLARGDLDCRLPSFRLGELNRISEVFNALSTDLSKATAERAELARRLVDAQEQERRHIARELHDEIAQKLSALSALAACIRTGAVENATGLVAEARQMEMVASELMISLRRTLTYLRPQVIDDLGLIQSLQVLVDEHNNVAKGRTSYTIEVSGDVEQLRAETGAHVYRIVQEALTNAAKHANARNVKVMLRRLPGPAQEKISLSVSDDGLGRRDEALLPPGSGIIGMRERVAALSGRFAAGPRPGGGFGLQVEFPTMQQGA